MQPELSLTARWPAASPGRRYEATAESREQPQQYKAPPRMQLGSAAGQQRPPVADSWPRVEAAGVNPRAPQQFAPSAGPPREQMQPEDSMSSSDSNQQPSIQAAGNPNTNQRRSQDSEVRQQHQYLVANSIRNRGAGSSSAPSFNNRPSVAQMQPTTTSTTTTSAPPTSPQATSARDEIAPEVGATEEQPLDRVIATSGEQPAESNIDKSKLIPTSEVADSDQQDNEAKASQVKHSVVSPPQDQEQQQQQQSQSGGQQSVSSNVNEQSQPVGSRLSPGQSPSGDELAQDTGSKMQDNTEDEQIGAESAPSSSSSSSSSSLKTVEVEIPANEDPVRALIANSGHNNQFNSVRLSNVELNSAADKTFNGGYKHDPDGAHYNPRQVVSSYSSPDQVIQPREQVGEMKRSDKSGDSESSSIEAMMANGKSRFGARSQPQAAVQASAAPSEQPFLNHQMASGAADQGDERQIPSGKDEAQQVNPDRVLIDRSDDSSSLTELSSSGLDSAMAASNDQASIAKPDSSSSSQQESAVVDDGASSASGTSDTAASSGKVKPVVGTEELASGPLQIEDRIGAPAPQDSLEEALSRLQQQVPQSAALVNSEQQAQSANPQQQPQEAGAYPSSAPEAERRSDTMMKQADNVPEKLTERADTSRDQKLPMTTGQQQQLALKQQAGQQEVSQPYPNVVGQVKVIPDPMSSLNARGSMLAQASNVEGVANGVLSLPAGAGKQPTGSKPPATPDVAAQQQQSIASKPVAQITNVPINIGFPPSQIPAIQQISQQLAYFQQQQQMQQQQQQPKVTTAKPSRGRFGLISPQAALQAVASRFLPKSTVQAPAQQQHHQLAMSPQLMSSINKLSPEQQQKLFAAAPLQTPTQPNQFAQTAQQQQQLQNRFTPPQVQQQQKSSLGGGLFRRFNQQQPLVRSRRSAIMPNGKRGSGEVGMTKTFMVVTGMDLAFMPNTTDTELPPILEGRRLVEDDVIYGVCMPVVSLTFVLTCAFWLIVFVVSFCIYMLIKARKLRRQTSMSEKR